VDDVDYPSWQAQIKGEKLWILDPPRECHYTCKRLEVIVHTGEISERYANINNELINCFPRLALNAAF